MSTEWKPAPTTANEAMQYAGARVLIDALENRPRSSWAEEAGRAYAAMLAASPQPAAQPEQPEPGVLTDTQIEFALNCHLEDPSDDESSGFYAGARWAEAFLSIRKLSDEQRARIMEAVEYFASFPANRAYAEARGAARAEFERLLGGEA